MQLEQQRTAPDAAVAILRQAVRAGVNHIDTAQFYGSCNALIREALAPYPDELVLVTKVGAARDPAGALTAAQRPEQLRDQVEANLAALGAGQAGVVNLRRLDAPPGLIAEGDQLVSLDDQLAELSALRDAGTIGAIGLSGVSAAQLGQALPAGITCVQNSYSVLERSAEPVLALCREHGIAWVPFFPLGSGSPNRPRASGNPAITGIADRIGATPAQVALAWLLASYDNTLLIPGTADPAHLAENIAAGGLRLSPAAMTTLGQLAGPG
jgi:aryl-alcohol dehydrogenase-like predicted oxidoreductase